MSKTKKQAYTTNLFSHGTSNSHHSLKREMNECHGEFVADSRGLIDRCDYRSDRLKGFRKVENHRRRAFQKEKVMNIIKEELENE